MINTSAGAAWASSAGPGHRFIHANHGSHTRATWVCCSITSETSTPHGVTSGPRQGKSRAFAAYQSRILVCTCWMWVLSGRVVDVMVPMVVVTSFLSGQVAKLWGMSDQHQYSARPKRIPPHVLRRRRIIAVLILLVILGLLGWGIWALAQWIFSGDEPEATQPTPTVTETVSPEPEESASDDDVAAQAECDPEMLTLTGATDQQSYAPGESVTLTMTVTHDGDVLCDASLGSDQQRFLVEDADGGFVFSTRACQVDPQEQVVEMEPGQSESVSFVWERVGTDEECQQLVEDVASGQYRLLVGLGDRLAEPVEFVLEEDE